MYTTVSVTRDVEQLEVGTVGWDRGGTPVARDADGWFVVGGSRIADLPDRLPLVVPTPDLPVLTAPESPCESCATEQEAQARPAPASAHPLTDRVAELIRMEFPDVHPHSLANRLRSESAAARIITFLAAQSASHCGPGTDDLTE